MDISKKIIKFKEKIEKIYPEKFEEIFKSLEIPTKKTFWILKSRESESVLDSMKKMGFDIEESSIKDFYIVSPTELKLSESKEFLEAQIYLQEFSSLLPCLVLNPNPGEIILDMCAAPGSKTLFLNKISESKSQIYANEIDRKRFFKMKANFEKYGFKNINLLNLDGVRIPSIKKEFLNYFDKILLDVPCSSENELNFYNLDSFKFWNYKKYKKFFNLQKKLLAHTFELLKPGGEMVYSTCTYSVEENELVIDWFVKNFGESSQIISIKEVVDKYKEFDFLTGISKYKNKEFDSSVTNSIRIIPNEFARSFFVCKIKKI